jgi:hypothetical protein
MPKPKTAYLHRNKGMVKVKVGFSWPAFFFGSLWAAAKRMWLPEFFLLVAVDAGLWFLTGVAEANHQSGLAIVVLFANIGYAFIRGKRGNHWLSASLVRRGYAMQSTEHAVA